MYTWCVYVCTRISWVKDLIKVRPHDSFNGFIFFFNEAGEKQDQVEGEHSRDEGDFQNRNAGNEQKKKGCVLVYACWGTWWHCLRIRPSW